MTETMTEEPELTEDPTPEVSPEPEVQQEPEEDPQPASRADREARLRKRAQEAETERDQLREVVAGLRRSEVERRISEVLTNPSDVWHAAKVEDLVGKDGVLDNTKIEAVITTIRAEHPNWMKPQRLPGNQRAAGPLSEVRTDGSEGRWHGAFAPRPVR